MIRTLAWMGLIALCAANVLAQPPAAPITDAPAAAAPAAAPPIRDISPDLAALIEKHKLPAMAAITIEHGVIVAQGVAGVRKQGSDEKATLGDLWHLGSCTKSLTATMCAILVEKGTLKWEMTVAEAFPDLAPKMNEQFKTITLQHLLTNRAGVPGDLNFDGTWNTLWHFDGTPTAARRLLLERVCTRPPAFDPGTKYEYSNSNFALAGHIAETITGKSYEALMQELLFAPLGMTTCGWGSPGATAPKGEITQPWGHGKNNKPINPRPAKDGSGPDNPPAIAPAGRLHCTIADWAKYVAMHELGGKLNPQRECKLLKPETYDRLLNPPDAIGDYAYGWIRTQRPWGGPEHERYVLTHSGSNNQWFCIAWVSPRQDFAVLVCCNSAADGASKGCDEACGRMIRQMTSRAKKAESDR